jgi:DNA-binding MarR family transcriptional regulator
LLDRLEKMSLVIRERCTQDRRVVYVDLTPKGRVLVNQLDQPLSELNQKLLGHLSATELKELNRLLEKARTSLDHDA